MYVYNGSTYVYKKGKSRKEHVKEEKMLGKNVKEKCCKVVNLNSFKDQFRNKNFNGMSGPNGRFRLEFCNFVWVEKFLNSSMKTSDMHQYFL